MVPFIPISNDCTVTACPHDKTCTLHICPIGDEIKDFPFALNFSIS